MKTKFILHGGFTKGKTDEDNSKFYKEILNDAPEGARILLVCFAKDDERIQSATNKVMTEFEKNKWQSTISFEIANQDRFEEQVKCSEVIYFHGGITLKLLEILKQYENLKKLLIGKIVAGESAGANVFGKFFYSPNADLAEKGLGFLPIKIIPHYCKKYSHKLDNVGENIELVLLPEYYFKVFNVNL